MHEYYWGNNTFTLQQELFAKPDMQNYQMTPEHADYLFMKNESELVNLEDVKGRIAAEGALPTHQACSLFAPGEKWSDIDQNILKF